MTAFGIVLVVAGVLLLVAAVVGTRRNPHPTWNWRYGPGRWLATAGTACLLAGVLDLLLA